MALQTQENNHAFVPVKGRLTNCYQRPTVGTYSSTHIATCYICLSHVCIFYYWEPVIYYGEGRGGGGGLHNGSEGGGASFTPMKRGGGGEKKFRPC